MKLMLRTKILLPIILLSPFVVQSQVDSIAQAEIDSTAVFYFVGSIDSLALNKLHHIDTTLTKFHQFDASFSNNNYYTGKGNIGQHSKNLKFKYVPIEGFNYSTFSLDLYSYKNSEVKYYKLTKPYTELYYVQGPEKEKTLEVVHTQNIMPRLNAGIRFRFITAPGLYERQKTDNKNLYLTVRYRTANSRYGFILNYLHNKLDTQENGGIFDRPSFEENLEPDRLLIPVNLTEASNLEVLDGFYLNHYFNIGKPKTIVKDSLDNIIDRKGFSFGRLTHTMTYDKHRMSFRDNMNSNDSLFYQPRDSVSSTIYDNPIHNTITFDSTSISKLENQITWSNLDYDDDPENKALYFYFGIKSQIINISDAHTVYDTLTTIDPVDGSEKVIIIDTLNINKRTYNQLIPKAGFSIFAFKSSRLNVEGRYVLGGYNGGDFSLNASLSQYLGTSEKNWGKLTLESAYTYKAPDWFYTYHQGNNIRWDYGDTHFEKEKIFYFKAHYNYKGLYLGASYFKLDNYIYLDETAHPEQFGSTSLFSANLRYALKLGKWNFDFDVIYQKNKDEIINVPEFLGNFSVYFTKSILQKVAVLQPGIEVFYNTAYNADAYMPAIRSFYVQNTESIGNKFYVDIFLNVKIKRTLFFLRYQHANSKLSKAYYLSPGYPAQDASFRFGLSWKFYD